MARRSKFSLNSDIATLLPDNSSGEISPLDLRIILNDLIDSLAEIGDFFVDKAFSVSTNLSNESATHQFLEPQTGGLHVRLLGPTEVLNKRFVFQNTGGLHSFVIQDSSQQTIFTVNPAFAVELFWDGMSWTTLGHGISQNAIRLRGRSITTTQPSDDQVIAYRAVGNDFDFRDTVHELTALPGIVIDATDPFIPILRAATGIVDVSIPALEIKPLETGLTYRAIDFLTSPTITLETAAGYPDGSYFWVYAFANAVTLTAFGGQVIDSGTDTATSVIIPRGQLAQVVKQSDTAWDIVRTNLSGRIFEDRAIRSTSLTHSTIEQLATDLGSVQVYTGTGNVAYNLNASGAFPGFWQIVQSNKTSGTLTIGSTEIGGITGHTVLRPGDAVLITEQNAQPGYHSILISETTPGFVTLSHYSVPNLIQNFTQLIGTVAVVINVPQADRVAITNVSIEGRIFSVGTSDLFVPTLVSGQNVLVLTVDSADTDIWNLLQLITPILNYTLDGGARTANGQQIYIAENHGIAHLSDVDRVLIIGYDKPTVVADFDALVGTLRMRLNIPDVSRITITSVGIDGVAFTVGGGNLVLPTLEDGANNLISLTIASGDAAVWDLNETFLTIQLTYTLDGVIHIAFGPSIVLASEGNIATT